MKTIEVFMKELANLVWGPATIFIFLGVGLYLTVLFGFFQFTHFKHVFKITFGSFFSKSKTSSVGVSAFEAVSTALAGSLGTGNIVGVATALCSGGPGAIFWMWVTALLGTILKFSEVVLSMCFRVHSGDCYLGGPMYVMERGLKWKFLGKVFAFFCVLASFGVGSTAQANSAVLALENGFNVPKLVSVFVLLVVFSLIIAGGIKRISVVAAKVVPIMSIIYIAFAIYIILKNVTGIVPVFRMIFASAFNFRAAAGGQAGYFLNLALKYGVARSVFISEAGMGSSPIAHAASNSKSEIKQGCLGIFEVFFNTVVMCTMTALVILMTGALNITQDASQVTMIAFSKEIGMLARWVLAVSLALFGFTTIMSWSYYGEQSVIYCFGKKFVAPYRIIYIASIGAGGLSAMSLVWHLSDVFNFLISLPNLLSIVLLSPHLKKLVGAYRQELKKSRQ